MTEVVHIIYAPNGKAVGKVVDDAIIIRYESHRTDKHLMRKFDDGVGISKKVLDALVKHRVTHIIINYDGERHPKGVYHYPLTSFLRARQKHDEDGDVQHFVPLGEGTTGIRNNALDEWIGGVDDGKR